MATFREKYELFNMVILALEEIFPDAKFHIEERPRSFEFQMIITEMNFETSFHLSWIEYVYYEYYVDSLIHRMANNFRWQLEFYQNPAFNGEGVPIPGLVDSLEELFELPREKWKPIVKFNVLGDV